MPKVFRLLRPVKWSRYSASVKPAVAGGMFVLLIAVATTGWSAEEKTPGPGPTATAFPIPVKSVQRRFVDAAGKIYLLKMMSSWAMAQNCSDVEITQALEGLRDLGFNAVTVSPFGVHMHDSFGDRYRNKAGQAFFENRPYASPLGPAWASMDRVMQEATRLKMTVVFSIFLSWGNTGTVPDLIAAGPPNAYNFGKAVARRYAGYSNLVWHVMGDFRWRYHQGPAVALDAMFHGLRDGEGAIHRLILAEPVNGSTSYEQFISLEGNEGYQWFRQSAETVYQYGSHSVEQFDQVYQRREVATYPVVDIEPPYVNAPHYKGRQSQELRERNYATFIRGGAGINFGHEKWWPFGVTGLYDGGAGWLDILHEAPQLDAKYAWKLLDADVADPAWRPDAGVFLTSGAGTGDDKAASGYSSRAAMVYFPTRRPIVINTRALAAGDQVRVRWYDPSTGTFSVLASAEAKKNERAVPFPESRHADGFEDWVLVVESL